MEAEAIENIAACCLEGSTNQEMLRTSGIHDLNTFHVARGAAVGAGLRDGLHFPESMLVSMLVSKYMEFDTSGHYGGPGEILGGDSSDN